MLFQDTTKLPFKEWLTLDKENKRMLWFSVIILTSIFILLKIIYPYPNFMPPDSYNYLEAAYDNELISVWPIGYSKYLRLISCISNSHLFLVFLQYSLLQLSLLYFIFTIRYLLSPGKWLFRLILTTCIINPLFPQIANFVSSDCLFTTLSLIWFTQLMWIIHQPNKRSLILHAFILLVAFMVRHNALFYPPLSIGVILLCRGSGQTKKLGIGAIALLLLAFIGRTQFEYYRKTGTPQYSAFGGWQIAANALYGYAHAVPISSAFVPDRYKKLHTEVNQHMKGLKKIPSFLRPDNKIGVYYLWDFNSPLILYREKIWKHSTSNTYFKKWSTMAPLYSGYGFFLIRQHPLLFVKHYVVPNLTRFFAPPAGFMSYDNLTRDSVDNIAVRWFGLKTNELSTNLKGTNNIIEIYYSVAFATINILFILCFLAFLALNGLKKTTIYVKSSLCLSGIYWCTNLVFSVLSAPIELRYQLPNLIITMVNTWILLSFIITESKIKSSTVKVNLTHNLTNPNRS